MKVNYEAKVADGATQWYGTIVVSNLRYEDGSTVTVNQYLAMSFTSPASVDATAIEPSLGVWSTGDISATSTQIGDGTFEIDATIAFTTSYAMQPADQITIGINGDLTANPQMFLDSFVFGVDQPPDISGTITVSCAPCPDPALLAIVPSLTFTRGDSVQTLDLTYGAQVSGTFEQGSYAISGDALETGDQTVVAPLTIAPADVDLVTGQTVAVSVTFPTVEHYCALDVSIGDLAGLSTETLQVTLTDTLTGATLAAFAAGVNSTTALRKLPPSGTAHISVQSIALNNTNYTFNVPDVALANAKLTVTIDDTAVKRTPVDATGFVMVPISVQADQPVDREIVLRLDGADMTYTQTVTAASQQTAFSVPVEPGTYAATTDDFLLAGIVYVVDLLSQFSVPDAGGATLPVSISASANLNVRGFPPYLSFGGITNLTPGNEADFVAARASSIFAYAGVDGAGDSTVYLTDDTQTTATIQLARTVEADLGGAQSVLPVIVSYTCNLSLGDTPDMLADSDAHAHSFANYMLALDIATTSKDPSHSIPAGFIVNPDFLGACQQGNYGPTYAMPVVAPLQSALDHWSITATIPPEITDTIAGYVLAVNWLTRTVAPDITFGWQINLWGVGYSEWIYDGSVDPASMAAQTADYVQSLGAYSGPYAPDFLAIDRYEADDFTQRAYVNGYCYGPREWSRYFDFCKAVSRCLKLPVMPWQIPASRTPVTTDPVAADFDPQHWGTGGSCLLGDAAVGSDYHHVHPTILALQFPSAFQQYMGDTVEDMFIRSEPFDITNPSYGDFPLRGIFAVLLGGGATTGIVSAIGNPEPWARDKLATYMQKPISFDV